MLGKAPPARSAHPFRAVAHPDVGVSQHHPTISWGHWKACQAVGASSTGCFSVPSVFGLRGVTRTGLEHTGCLLPLLGCQVSVLQNCGPLCLPPSLLSSGLTLAHGVLSVPYLYFGVSACLSVAMFDILLSPLLAH